MYVIRLSFSLFVALVPLAAQVVPGRYIVELSEEPAALAKDRRSAVRSAQDRTRRALADRGLNVLASVGTVANALIVEAGSETELASLPGIRRVHAVRLYKKLLDRAVMLQKVTDAWSLVGGVENAGRGIKIGIIDTGIDPRHPGLQDPDLAPPEGFPKVTRNADIENTNNKVIVARNYDRRASSTARDGEGHGTGVAMIAAGRTVSGPQGVIAGIAPKAWLGNYKVFAENSESASSDAILQAIDDAVTDGMDVINLSLGTFPAEPQENDILVTAVERASRAGVIVVVAAGNSGPSAATIGSPGTATSAITVGNAANDRIFASSVQVEGAGPFLAIPASGFGTNAPAAGILRDVADLDPSGLACSELPADSLSGRIAFILRGVCFFEDKLRNAQRAGAVAAIVYTHSDSPEPSIMDPGSARLPGVMISNRDGIDLKARIAALPSVAAVVNFAPSPISANASRLSTSSSRGPSVDASVKPEILGVGTSVYTAGLSSATGSGYQVNSGTSFSSPMIAGAVAVLKAARPGLTPQQYRSLLINASSTFSYDQVVPGPVQQTGAGLLNLASSVTSTITASPQTINFGSGTADANRTVSLTLANIGTNDDTYSISLNPLNSGPEPLLSATSLAVPAGQTRDLTLRFEASRLSAGHYQGFVVVRSSVSNSHARIPYWYGIPSDVVDNILIADPPETAGRSSLQELFIRPSDASGFAVDVPLTISVVEGGGSVGRIRRSGSFPGFWVAEVRLGSQIGANVYEVTAGGKTTRLSILSD